MLNGGAKDKVDKIFDKHSESICWFSYIIIVIIIYYTISRGIIENNNGKLIGGDNDESIFDFNEVRGLSTNDIDENEDKLCAL